ncbi:MAG TPA: tetratricopeptide repeat protein [Longimicrobiales bacterium]
MSARRSRSQRTRARDSERDLAPAGPAARRVSRSAIIAGIAGVSLLAVAAYFLLQSSRALLPFPQPPRSLAGGAVSPDDFAGAEACSTCHAAQFDRWQSSTHGRAGGTPAPDHIVAPFDGRPMRFRDATVTPLVDGRGRYVFVIRQDGRPERTLEVDGVIGGAHMVGGGTQGFATEWPDGSRRFLPFEWTRDEGVWFCNTDSRAGRGWLPITPDLALADCGDWTPVRTLGELPRFANCQQCHGSQIHISPAPGRPNRTSYRSLAIDCEACHGPARRHADAMATPGNSGTDADIHGTLAAEVMPPSLETLSKDQSLEVCFQCHALKDALQPGYLPGRPLQEHYSTGLALLSEEPVFADGRIRTFAYQQGHLWSDCYLSGSMTCTSCHDPHDQSYRDANGLPLSGRFADGQCTACHASKAVDSERHTKHAAESAGSRCVACHMPYLQEPAVGRALRYARSDHTIPLPRPAFDAALGVEVACAQCHTDRPVDTIGAQVRDWWGTLEPHHPLVAGLASEAVRTNRDSLTALLIRAAPSARTGAPAPPRHIAAEVVALGTLLRDHLEPDSDRLPDRLAERLRAAAADPNPDIAALGLAALHWTRGSDPGVRRFLVERLDSLDLHDTAVRSRWALLLGFLGDNARAAANPRLAATAYRKGLEIRPTDAAILTRLGLAHQMAGDATAALDALERAAAADPMYALAWLNLGVVRTSVGDQAGAAAAYAEALRADSTDAIVWLNLGNIELRAARFESAIDYYRKALAYEPALAPAHFNHARALLSIGRVADARIALRNGLDFDPGNVVARNALAELDTLR